MQQDKGGGGGSGENRYFLSHVAAPFSCNMDIEMGSAVDKDVRRNKTPALLFTVGSLLLSNAGPDGGDSGFFF